MNGISFQLDETKTYVDATIKPLVVSSVTNEKALLKELKASSYAHFYVHDEAIADAIVSLKSAQGTNNDTDITARIAEKKPAQINCRIEDNDMIAFLKVTAPYGDTLPSAQTLLSKAKKQGILRGISNKNVAHLIEQLLRAKPGEEFEIVLAKGMPQKNGRDSRLKPLVPNALERILKPQSASSTRVDMRNLGDVICVKTGAEVLRRMPPTKGRDGFTVTNLKLAAKPGNWIKFRPGSGIEQCPDDENLYIASITGMPKFKHGKMWIDDIFICNGVNIGTGNVHYDGSIIVNGDVTENMIISAKGDVTINGFVESAQVTAGGDIIITEGAMGKVNEESAQFSSSLVAEGSIHVQHGQGLDINCKGNFTIGRQIAYSKINCAGSITVGPIDKPNGNLFACEVHCNGPVVAGTMGAVSGSQLSIDFSSGFNNLVKRKETIDELVRQIKDNNLRHQDKFALMRSKQIHPELKNRFDEAETLLNNESQLLKWLAEKAQHMQIIKDTFLTDIKLVANKKLHGGVSVKLNDRTWRAEREYSRAKVVYTGRQWICEPLE